MILNYEFKSYEFKLERFVYPPTVHEILINVNQSKFNM